MSQTGLRDHDERGVPSTTSRCRTRRSPAPLGFNTYLVRWANLIHHERGLDHIRRHVTDGGLIVAPS
ncbi:hypothetical protein GTY54_27195 [Streptomyces sp. SID625]|nr:hypothetical protein [Streptomyces sp. SID625]